MPARFVGMDVESDPGVATHSLPLAGGHNPEGAMETSRAANEADGPVLSQEALEELAGATEELIRVHS